MGHNEFLVSVSERIGGEDQDCPSDSLNSSSLLISIITIKAGYED